MASRTDHTHSRKGIPVALLCLGLGLGLSLVLSPGCKSPEQPNFLFILVDDLGWKDLGCYGSTYHRTPRIDELAGMSVKFSNAYSSASVCSPSRAAILTGKNPARVNITDWIPGDDPGNRELLGPADLNELPLAETTIAEILLENGYRTFYCGKWHLGGEGYLPEMQGFETNLGGFHRGSPPGGYFSPYKNPKLTDGPEGEYLPDRLTRETIEFMRESADLPFFAFLSYYTVHTPIQASPRHREQYVEGIPGLMTEGEAQTTMNQYNADYASMVAALDENIGRLIDSLEVFGILDKTVIIFTSDNGGLSTLRSSYSRAAPTSVQPLRAGKGWLYEGGIRVPLLIKASIPGLPDIPVSDEPVTGSDFFPTMLNLAGIPMSDDTKVDGVDISGLWNGREQLNRDALYWHYPHYHGSGWKPGAAIRMGDWKLIEFQETGNTELYRLTEDISEKNDLAATHPEIADSLLQRLRIFQKEHGAQPAVANPVKRKERYIF